MGSGSPLGTTSGSGSCGEVVMPSGTRSDRPRPRPFILQPPGYRPRVNEDDSQATGGRFERDEDYIPDRITAGGRKPEHGPRDVPLWPVEAGRYRLVAARACPWASRAVVVRELLGLQDVVSLGLCGPTHDVRSWTFDLDPGGVDPVLGIERLQQAYFARFPAYEKGITVPAMVDVPTGQVVTNDFPWMTHDLFHEWREFHRPDAPDLWPASLREEMDEVMKRVYTEVNNGVYRCGFASSQEAYDAAYDRLWAGLDWLEERLTHRRYLMGEQLTEADVRLFTTLVRFDAVYHGHFKCNRQKLTELPALWRYARDLFQTAGFGDTVDFDQIKRHYYVVHGGINPTGIVPDGPDLSGWVTPDLRAGRR
jgi:putative glutathione S-transferase